MTVLHTYNKKQVIQTSIDMKLKFSEDIKQAIANATGLVYLADNLEKRDVSDGEEVAKMLRFYGTSREAHEVINASVLPAIKASNPGFDYPGSGDEPQPPVEAILKAVNAAIVFDEASYNAIVDAEYRDKILRLL